MQITPSAAKTASQPLEGARHSASYSRGMRPWQFVLIGVVAAVVAHLLDGLVWDTLRDPRVNDRDWGRMLRTMGYVPLWAVLGVGTGLHDRVRGLGPRRGWLLVGAPLLSGAVAELCKLLLRRLRPNPERFDYVFRAFSDDSWSTRGLGMPSSHVMVAFAGAAVLSRLFPETRALWYLLAAGCALTRIMSLGHFLSDTVVAAFLGVLVASALMRKWPVGSATSAFESTGATAGRSVV
ncbi:MAG TPA: phosphatase PAP2 family protein [Gemmatimonas sp.]|nr:phosphatase PAP2 family protein [Gemmatimonas sp.]